MRRYDLNIWAYTRVDTIKDGMLEKLKAAGFNWLAVGVESGAGRVRADVDKAFGQDEVYRVVEQIRGAGINVIGNYIFGLPEDDADTMRATLDLAVGLNCEFANFYSAMAYPGSPLYALAASRGVPLPESWTGYSQHSHDCLPLPTRHVPAREVLRFRDEAFVKYYTNPHYLEMIGRRFGPETVAHLRDVTGHRLERDLLTGRAGDSSDVAGRGEGPPEARDGSAAELVAPQRPRIQESGFGPQGYRRAPDAAPAVASRPAAPIIIVGGAMRVPNRVRTCPARPPGVARWVDPPNQPQKTGRSTSPARPSRPIPIHFTPNCALRRRSSGRPCRTGARPGSSAAMTTWRPSSRMNALARTSWPRGRRGCSPGGPGRYA